MGVAHGSRFSITPVGPTGRLFTEVQSKLLNEPRPVTDRSGQENFITRIKDAKKQKNKNTEYLGPRLHAITINSSSLVSSTLLIATRLLLSIHTVPAAADDVSTP